MSIDRHYAIASLVSLLCMGLLWLAVPRFVGSLYALHPQATLDQQHNNLPIDAFHQCIRQLDDALAWDNNPEYWQNRGLCYLALSKYSEVDFIDRMRYLNDAKVSISNGLKLSPVDPYAWFRLAVVEHKLDQPNSVIRSALQMSFYAGRVEPDLVIPRLIFAYDFLTDADQEFKIAWQKQLPIAWQFQKNKLLAFVMQKPDIKPMLETSFELDPTNLANFLKAFESASKKTTKTKIR